LKKRPIVEPHVGGAFRFEECFHLVIGKRRTKISPLHPVPLPICNARLVFELMPDAQGRPEGSACISGRRLNPQPLERSLPENSTIPHTVQRDAARQTQIFYTGFPVQCTRKTHHHFLSDLLNRPCQVHLTLLQLGLWVSWWPPKHLIKFSAGHRQSGAVIEV